MYARTNLILVFAGLIIVLPVGCAVYEFFVNINRSLNNISATLEKISRGDLRKQSLPMLSSNETGFMSDDMSRLLESLRIMLDVIKQSAFEVQTGSGEIRVSAQTLAGAAGEEASNVAEMTASVEEVSSSIEQSAENAMTTSRNAQEISQQSVEGRGE